MGNSQPPSTHTLTDIYRLIKKSPGGLTMFQDVSTGKEYVLKELTSNDQNHFQSIRSAVDRRRGVNHQHLLAIKELETKVENNFCSNQFKLLMMVEYPFRNLYEEVEERRQGGPEDKEYFTENELWSVMYSCVLGLEKLYSYQGVHQSLCSCRVYIQKDGLVKLGDPFLLSHPANTDSFALRTFQQHIYLSPQQIQFLLHPKHQYKPQVSDVFTLGMVLIEAACLDFLDELYEQSHTVINEKKLAGKLAEVRQRYGGKLGGVLARMVDFMPSRRMGLQGVREFIQGETFDEEEGLEVVVGEKSVEEGKMEVVKIQQQQQQQSMENSQRRVDEVRPTRTPLGANNLQTQPTNRTLQTNTTSFDRTWDSKTTQQAIQQANMNFTTTPNMVSQASYGSSYGSVYSQPAMVPAYQSKFPSSSTIAGMGNSYYGSNEFSKPLIPGVNPSYGQVPSYGPSISNFPNTYISNLPYTSPAPTTVSAYSSPYTTNPSLRNPAVGNWTSPSPFPPANSNSLPPPNLSFLPPNPTPTPTLPIKQDSLDNNSTTTMRQPPRLSPPSQPQSLSPVQQLTPQRRDSFPTGPPLPPNSTIAQVTQSQFSASSTHNNSLTYEVQQFQQGSRYQGHKLHGMRHGMGRFHYQDGGYYEGEWQNNKMNGFGKLFYQNGDLAYEGFWKDDMFHGKGKVFNDSPKKLTQPFDYSNLSGLDECWIYYDGEFEEDSKEGPGKVQLSNGEVFEGEFQKDVIQGEGRFVTMDGEVVHGVWRDNRLVERLE